MKFSLRTLFIWLTAIAVYLAIVFAVPASGSMLLMFLISCLLGPAILTGVLYARGHARTFWIGCATTGILPYVILVYHGTSFEYLRNLWRWDNWTGTGDKENYTYPFVAAHLLILASGLVAVAVRRFVSGQKRSCEMSAATTHPQGAAEDVSSGHQVVARQPSRQIGTNSP
ncbi:MAG: hypothetical protein O3C40_22030 [Planctomycetota bacterium]|nr:hypothetical protein [Planctomycetota bacterium]